MSERVPRDSRRHLNSQEAHDMGFVDMQTLADEDGWPYPDDDDDETTERRFGRTIVGRHLCGMYRCNSRGDGVFEGVRNDEQRGRRTVAPDVTREVPALRPEQADGHHSGRAKRRRLPKRVEVQAETVAELASKIVAEPVREPPPPPPPPPPKPKPQPPRQTLNRPRTRHCSSGELQAALDSILETQTKLIEETLARTGPQSLGYIASLTSHSMEYISRIVEKRPDVLCMDGMTGPMNMRKVYLRDGGWRIEMESARRQPPSPIPAPAQNQRGLSAKSSGEAERTR